MVGKKGCQASLIDQASDDGDGKGAAALHVATRRCDGNKAREDAVAEATDVVLLGHGQTQHLNVPNTPQKTLTGVFQHGV